MGQAAARKSAGALPAPPLTRARAKLAAAPTLSSMSTYKSRRADDGFEHGEALYDENTYDPYIHHRLMSLESTFMNNTNLNPEWRLLRGQKPYLGLVPVCSLPPT